MNWLIKMSFKFYFLFGIVTSLLGFNSTIANGQTVSAPLFIDPNYRGSCDPEIVWNEVEQLWYIYYTARRPMLKNTWLRTPIGVIASKDMVNWEFKGYCMFDGVGGEKDAPSTYWDRNGALR